MVFSYHSSSPFCLYNIHNLLSFHPDTLVRSGLSEYEEKESGLTNPDSLI
jgi:hypothetical protein